MSSRYVVQASRRLCRQIHTSRSLSIRTTLPLLQSGKPEDTPSVSTSSPKKKESTAASALGFQKRENAAMKARWDAASAPENELLYYPRAGTNINATYTLNHNFNGPEETHPELEKTAVINGRIQSRRDSSSKLIFLDIVEAGRKLQVVCSAATMGLTQAEFKSAHSGIKKGDIVGARGYPGVTKAGEKSIFAVEPIKLFAPSLHNLPTELTDSEKRHQNRHVDLIINPKYQQILKARSFVFNTIREYLGSHNFVEVSTPIISELSGGAVAKPFETVSKDLGSDRKLQLRIAPELWLKRLVIGGLDKVYEIGPNFRNESADATHNPEFYTCEFYEAFQDLEGLKRRTQELIVEIVHKFRETIKGYPDITPLKERRWKLTGDKFREIDFINGIEERMGRKLPILDEDGALDKLLGTMDECNVARPLKLTLPGVLDHLASVFLEPECVDPIYIVNIPACMSPLAKCSRRNSDGQLISHRAELFVDGKELANLYEEENSPFAQRRKFEEQNKYRLAALHAANASHGQSSLEKMEDAERVDPEMPVDESYIGALEWGLPPTGGWGMGLDRLMMLLCGVDRIADVMAFGGLRGTALASRKVVKVKEQVNAEDKTEGVAEEVERPKESIEVETQNEAVEEDAVKEELKDGAQGLGPA